MKIVSPSLLSCDFLNIEQELSYFKDVKDLWFHLDIMDGHFVPNLTFGHPIVELISNKTDIPLDAHFMVENPEFYIDTFKDYNIHNFTFHFEATDKPLELIKKAKEHYPSVGISIKPKTSPDVLTKEILENVDLVLVMSVEPGFGGQKFMPNSFEKISKLRKHREENKCRFQIQVDGGVSNQNSTELYDTGADNLVAGSYVFKEGPTKYLEKIESMRNG